MSKSFLKFQSGVVVPRVCIIAAAAHNARLSLDIPWDTLVTSGNDKVHMRGSKHYSDEALDFRTRDISDANILRWASAIRSRLGKDYQVVIENDHLHVEFDPKTP